MKKITAIILSCVLLCMSLLSPMQAHADNIFTYAKDAVEMMRNLFGIAGDVANGTYDFTMKVVDDIVSGLTSDMDVAYNPDNNTFNFPVDESNNVVISQKFYNLCYDKAQEYIHTLDGYYLFEQNYNFSSALSYVNDQSFNVKARYDEETYNAFLQCWSNANVIVSDKMFLYDCSKVSYSSPGILCIPDCYLYVGSDYIYCYSPDNSFVGKFPGFQMVSIDSRKNVTFNPNTGNNTSYKFSFLKEVTFYYGSPLKIFYSKKDLTNYLNKGKTYIPRINVNSTGIHIKQEHLNNNTVQQVINNIINNNNYDYSSNDEINIQNSLDNDVNIALSDLFSDGSDPTLPTPTPTPGGSGGSTPTPTPSDPFGDGTTPTPIVTPIPGGDGDSSWLKKIYEALAGFVESWGAHSDNLIKTLSESNVKLDGIITAIDKIVSGDVSGTSGNCKYDYTALSDFLTQLWNESDKKFDTMIELLEENNEYQQKLLDSLNQIKALLVADTVLDFFKDRSNETANKAKDKFPTSIPWDIALVVNNMCAEPKDPVIRCPIVVSSLGINEEIVIDLSSEEWKKLAKTCRSLLSVLFILYLVHLTRELFFNGGDD